MHKKLLLSAFILWASSAFAQTVGLFKNDSLSYNGYTLFAPLRSKTTYLIDNCGKQVHSWQSSYPAGLAAYLLPNGNLIRAGRVASGIYDSGGVGGIIEEYDWQGRRVNWYRYSSVTSMQHHDFKVLPNGHILLLAWGSVPQTDAIAAGRNPARLTSKGIWPDHIVELDAQKNVVWKWDAWDHIIQDFDQTKDNYGVVADHPELIDINHFKIYPVEQPSRYADWMHSNSIDYNDSLDQILISVHNFDEIWVIDHSTTTAEAKGHTGGKYGKGGDLLYRYGNPQTYQRNGAQVFSRQHDAKWIPYGEPHGGKIMVFNNNGKNGTESTVEIIEPPTTAPGVYTTPVAPASYGPTASSWMFATGKKSDILSGASFLPNGNLLFCWGNVGVGEAQFREVTEDGTVVWEYVNPVGIFPRPQGIATSGREVFRAERYGVDFPGFQGKDLTPGLPVELNPTPYNCTIYPYKKKDVTGIETGAIAQKTITLQGIYKDHIQLVNPTGQPHTLEVYTLMGQSIAQATLTATPGVQHLEVALPKSGMYLFQFTNEHTHTITTQKITKHD